MHRSFGGLVVFWWFFKNKKFVSVGEGRTSRVMISIIMLNHVWLFATPWTEARQTPLSMGLWDPSKHNGVGCHFLLQGIVPIQDSNLLTEISCGSCIDRRILYHWNKPRVMVEESLPFFQSRDNSGMKWDFKGCLYNHGKVFIMLLNKYISKCFAFGEFLDSPGFPC